MSLFPTKTRLRRLRGVARREIFRYQNGLDYDALQFVCTKAMEDMAAAGWVELPPDGPPDGWPHKRAWLITDAGREILRRHP